MPLLGVTLDRVKTFTVIFDILWTNVEKLQLLVTVFRYIKFHQQFDKSLNPFPSATLFGVRIPLRSPLLKMNLIPPAGVEPAQHVSDNKQKNGQNFYRSLFKLLKTFLGITPTSNSILTPNVRVPSVILCSGFESHPIRHTLQSSHYE